VVAAAHDALGIGLRSGTVRCGWRAGHVASSRGGLFARAALEAVRLFVPRWASSVGDVHERQELPLPATVGTALDAGSQWQGVMGVWQLLSPPS